MCPTMLSCDGPTAPLLGARAPGKGGPLCTASHPRRMAWFSSKHLGDTVPLPNYDLSLSGHHCVPRVTGIGVCCQASQTVVTVSSPCSDTVSSVG